MKALCWVIFGAVLPVLAQGPQGGFAWWDSPIAKDLNLSAEQTQKIRETVREFRAKLIDQRAAVEKAEGELDDLFREGSVDQRRANETIDRLANARAELTRSFSQMTLRLRTVLTPEQWQELQRRAPGRNQGQPGRRNEPGMGYPGPGGRPRPMRSGPQQPPPEAPPKL